MFLKSLTLKGFKSFADATTFQLEPGVTVVALAAGFGVERCNVKAKFGGQLPHYAIGKAGVAECKLIEGTP